MVDGSVGTISSFDSPVVALAKLVPPRRRSDTVSRSELVNQVVESDAQVVAVTGPAGAGKSTLMAQCHEAEALSAWLSLDHDDNDPVVLWWELIESIRTVIDNFGDAYRHRLLTGGPAALDAVVTSVVNELAASQKHVRLYLDDLHVIGDELCRRSLQALIRQLPPDVAVIVASRGASPVPLARQRVAGNLLELGPEELAMSLDDARELVAGVAGPLDGEVLEQLVARTEGWPAGLHLAALALRSADDPASVVAELHGDDAMVSDYLVEEVLERVSSEDRNFMLSTSPLRRLSGELCDAVTGRTDSAIRLRELEAASAFLIPLDRVGTWYRYHHMFAELLQARLNAERPAEMQEINRRAFEWLRDDGQIAEAIHHALLAGRRRIAADLVCAHWFDLVNTGRIATAQQLFDRFDENETLEYQPLAVAVAFLAGLTGDLGRARHHIDAAEQSIHHGEPPDGTASMTSSLALARGSVALDGVNRALADGALAYALEPPDSPWRLLAGLIMGLAHTMKGELDDAEPYFQEAAQSEVHGIHAYAVAELSLIRLDRGDVDGAVALAEEALRVVEEHSIEDIVNAAVVYAAAAHTAIASDDRHRARALLAEAGRPMDATGQAMPMDAMHANRLLAEAAIELDQPDVARTYLRNASAVAAMIPDTGRMAQRVRDLLPKVEDARAPAAPSPEALTERELEVLALIPLGLTTREIGEELFLSHNTIKTYLRRLYRKLGASSRSKAVQRARELGLLPEMESSGQSADVGPSS